MRLNLVYFRGYSESLKELRFHFCPSGAESKGAKEYVMKSYQRLKQKNPDLPILIRECDGCQPKVFARYDSGIEGSKVLTGLGAKEVEKHVEDLGNRVTNY